MYIPKQNLRHTQIQILGIGLIMTPRLRKLRPQQRQHQHPIRQPIAMPGHLQTIDYQPLRHNGDIKEAAHEHRERCPGVRIPTRAFHKQRSRIRPDRCPRPSHQLASKPRPPAVSSERIIHQALGNAVVKDGLPAMINHVPRDIIIIVDFHRSIRSPPRAPSP